MRITEADKKFLKADIEVLKAPELDSPPAQRLPEVIETVSKMLSDIEKNGVDAVKRYARDLDKWDKDFELSAANLAKTGDKLSPELRKALESQDLKDDPEINTLKADRFGQRAFPFIQLLKTALAHEEMVIWGV